MKIERSKGLVIAQKIVEHLRKDGSLKEIQDVEASLGAYQNGREQGLSLRVTVWGPTAVGEPAVKNLTFFFAEYRIPDNIVVYETTAMVETACDIPDEVFAEGRQFPADKPKNAAGHIAARITDFVKRARGTP